MRTGITIVLLATTSLAVSAPRCNGDYAWYINQDQFQCINNTSFTNRNPVTRVRENFCHGTLKSLATGKRKSIMWVRGDMLNTCVQANSVKTFLNKNAKNTNAMLAICRADFSGIKSQATKGGFYCEQGWPMLHLKKFSSVSLNHGKCQFSATSKAQWGSDVSVRISWLPDRVATSCQAKQL